MAKEFELHAIFHQFIDEWKVNTNLRNKIYEVYRLPEIVDLSNGYAAKMDENIGGGIFFACMLWASEPQLKNYSSFVELWGSREVIALLNHPHKVDKAGKTRGIHLALETLYKLKNE